MFNDNFNELQNKEEDVASVLEKINYVELGNELKLAREQRALKQEKVAQELGIARTTLVAIEKGERKIRAQELIKLADIYGRRLSDFVRGRPTLSFSAPQFRSLSNISEEDRLAVSDSVAELQDLCRDYLELEEITQRPLNKNYPVEYIVPKTNWERSVESIAITERTRLGLGDNPIFKLRDLLEYEVGVRIFFLKMPGQFSGIYLFNEIAGACIAVNSVHPIERQRFTLVHDYFHFLTERYKQEITPFGKYPRKAREEEIADDGAIFFLMPTNNLIRNFTKIKEDKGSIKVGDLVTLANYYGVSLEAVVLRLEELGLVNTGTYERLKKGKFKVNEARQKLGLGVDSEYRGTLPQRYQLLALQAHKDALISNSQLASFLRIDLLEALSLAEIYQNAFEIDEDKSEFSFTQEASLA